MNTQITLYSAMTFACSSFPFGHVTTTPMLPPQVSVGTYFKTLVYLKRNTSKVVEWREGGVSPLYSFHNIDRHIFMLFTIVCVRGIHVASI